MNSLIEKTASKLPKLVLLEKNWKAVCCIPFLSGFFTVPENSITIIMRNGKYDGYREPGIRWAPVGHIKHVAFLADRNISQSNMYVTDSNKNPIIVTTSVTFRLINPLSKLVNVQNKEVIPRYFESFIRQTLVKYNYEELITNSKDIFGEFTNNINQTDKMEEYGIKIQRADLLDIKYSPEIAKSMLIKQQIQAMISARKDIVGSVVDIVEEINSKLELNAEDKSKLSCYLAISMITDKSPQFTYDLKN